ncbi:TetR/AcrR family transcriptional regulator [uncultured Kocuria sp.]|uniref:TetR/AcrR family transcriptional regulator n=1 Tax=uncultured Kocuria sp. TaxID=259305 RepID=UPI0026326903|nr:TetR/AcrR family transcriptional regulator [uncultured Kocuria sp.]
MKQVDATDSTAPGGTSATDGRSSRWARHRAQRRIELIRTARSAVDELGAQASMEEIASACQTSKSVYYRYFGDKAGLQRAVGEYTVTRMRDRLEEAARAAGSFEDSVEAMVAEYLLSIERSASVYRFVVALSPDPGRSRLERHRAERARGEQTRGERSGKEAAPAEDGGERWLIQEFTESVSGLLAEAHVRHTPAERRLEEPVLSYWAASTIGMVRGAGEAWMNTPEGTRRPSRARMTELIVGWAVDGLRPPGAPVPEQPPA